MQRQIYNLTFLAFLFTGLASIVFYTWGIIDNAKTSYVLFSWLLFCISLTFYLGLFRLNKVGKVSKLLMAIMWITIILEIVIYAILA